MNFVAGGDELDEGLKHLSRDRREPLNLAEARAGPLSKLGVVVLLGNSCVVMAGCPVLLAAVVVLGPVLELFRLAITNLGRGPLQVFPLLLRLLRIGPPHVLDQLLPLVQRGDGVLRPDVAFHFGLEPQEVGQELVLAVGVHLPQVGVILVRLVELAGGEGFVGKGQRGIVRQAAAGVIQRPHFAEDAEPVPLGIAPGTFLVKEVDGVD